MISLTTNIQQPNITRWRVIAFDIARGSVTLRFSSPGDLQFIDLVCTLSDTVNRSTGVVVNPDPQSWNDKVIVRSFNPITGGGMGAANSLTNAQNAYRSAGNHNAGLKAVEVQALADGWVDAALTGT